ncbi:GNAT family N-acetyltransferase [Vibrio sp. S4M6]|uniref:tRNA(Met) cytidine acetyltransferase TmcA n=1 Tax=Vibrio sinus TaxID=2946865 RepID=UPI002029BD4A|nr:GNAT family N-acetyltransferase [Vibrio sinus]MCL9781674.1 GNAT family N-acetyltransferase [Vibrio sinus]
MMIDVDPFFQTLQHLLSSTNQRCGVVLHGEIEWKKQQASKLIQLFSASHSAMAFQLGGESVDGINQHVTHKQGSQFLGKECSLLICDFEDGFDANSFNSAVGAIVAGGLLIVFAADLDDCDGSHEWLKQHLMKLINLSQDGKTPSLPKLAQSNRSENYLEQREAVQDIVRVVEGHAKRPLILTADRGRGKSSALGIAAAQLMKTRTLNIAVTAPNPLSVDPVFRHAERMLDLCVSKKNQLAFQGSRLTFIAPDELLSGEVEADVVFVDEASAIPVGLLKKMASSYNRIVFSTTIHGYEGCGRGFTLKFVKWLRNFRSGTRQSQLMQPIRWGENDWLESWQYGAFLLDVEPVSLSALQSQQLDIRAISSQEFLQKPSLLRACFALLVNAHYQTSPNDLMTLLGDTSIRVFAAFSKEIPVACVLAVEEGSLSEDIIDKVEQGTRRPKGHLTPISIIGSLGITQAARQKSLRIMRIAVHEELQRMGVGSALLEHICSRPSYQYFSTSFGMTLELLKFWQKNQFQLIKVGSKKDPASGCHSALMVTSECSDWLEQAKATFSHSIPYALTSYLRLLDPSIARELIKLTKVKALDTREHQLALSYTKIGKGYEVLAPLINQFIYSLPIYKLDLVSEILIAKVIQQRSFKFCAHHYRLTGRKQVEAKLKENLNDLA